MNVEIKTSSWCGAGPGSGGARCTRFESQFPFPVRGDVVTLAEEHPSDARVLLAWAKAYVKEYERLQEAAAKAAEMQREADTLARQWAKVTGEIASIKTLRE